MSSRPGRILLYAVLCLTSVVMLTPLVWLVAACLKHPDDLFSFLFFRFFFNLRVLCALRGSSLFFCFLSFPWAGRGCTTGVRACGSARSGIGPG